MQTLYIDVYFLINFTVDIIAIHFASLIVKVKISSFKLFLLSFVLSLVAVAIVLMPISSAWSVPLGLIFVPLLFVITHRQVSIARRIKFSVLFFAISFLIGGAVHSLYIYLSDRIDADFVSGGVNRGLLLFAIIILIVMGLMKLFSSFFISSVDIKSIRVKIKMNGCMAVIDSLVDTGNLLYDPVDLTPVMLIKRGSAEKLFPYGIPELDNYCNSELKINKRLIPVSKNGGCEIYVGFRPDSAMIDTGGREEEIKIVFIIDKEGGTFGGFEGLLPSSALK